MSNIMMWKDISEGTMIFTKLPSGKCISWLVIQKKERNITIMESDYKNMVGVSLHVIDSSLIESPSIMSLADCQIWLPNDQR